MDLARPDRTERLDALAAEYALGTLPPRARRRLARLAQADPRIGDAVRGWEYRLAAFAESLPGITPPPRVWNGIRERLGMADPAAPREPWWRGLVLWRGLAAAGFAMAAILAVLVGNLAGRAEPGLVVLLAGPDARPVLVASAARDSRTLLVKAVATTPLAADRALELWALPPGRNPQSLGLVAAAGVARLSLSAPAGTALENVPTLAVSLEPAGGSPTGQPTGPVLYTGAVQRFY